MMRTTAPIAQHVIGQDGLVVVQVRSGDLRLNGVPGDTVRIHAGPDDLRHLELEPGPDSLTVRVRGGRSPDLAIDVPANAAIVMEGASADVWAEHLRGDQRYRSASGDIDLRDVHGSVSVEAVSGDIDIVANGPSAIVARTVSGDLAVRAGTLTALRAGTTSGNLRIAARFEGPGPFALETVSGDAILAPADGLRVEATTITGDLRSDLPALSGGERGRRTMTVGHGGPTLTFRSTSGDLRMVPAVELARPAAPARTSGSPDDATPTTPPPPAPPRPDRPAHPADAIPPAPPLRSRAPHGSTDATPALGGDEGLLILQALERGEIDVAEAGRRLEALDPDERTSERTSERTTRQEADHVR